MLKIRSLRLKVFLIVGNAFIIAFVGSYLILYYSVKGSLQFMIDRVAEGVSKQVFASMYQVMKRGWNRGDLLEFLRSIEVSYSETPISVNIYRGEKVKELFGDVPEPQKSAMVLSAFKNKKESATLKEYTYISVYPVLAHKECLRCHVNAKEGDVLGVIESKVNMHALYSTFNKNMTYMSIFLVIVSFSVSTVVSLLVFKSIKTFKRNIEESVEKMQKLEDISSILATFEPPYWELDELYESLNRLAVKIREIAIDKDILELESRLLERFIITSQFVKDWKEYIKTLITDINEVVRINVVFSIFLEDSFVDVEVFWLKEPYKEQKEVFERSLEKEALSKLPISVIGSKNIAINHNIVIEGEHFESGEYEKYKLRTKALLLDKPHLGGIVGVGIESELIEDPYKHPVLDGILANLVNVIGSAKALSAYINEVEFYAMRDPLTLLYNQRTFWELLSYELERADRFNRSLSLIMIDLDNFKVINDTYGHAIGDNVLKEVARIISEKKRKADVAARYGGDEFTIIAVGASLADALVLAKRIKEAVESMSISVGSGDTIVPQISIGIATYPEHASTARDLFILADTMLRKAKEEGRSRIKTPTLEDLQASRTELTKKSILVLDSMNKGLITPYFQPMVELATGKVFANEVLMRIGEEKVPASEFIETAENLGVIVRMDLILYEKAIRKLVEENYDKHVFINLSSKAFLSEDFVKNIFRIIDDSKFKPENIVFELTERESIRNIDLVEKLFRRLKEFGVKLAIDDFGSGYSSFHYLKKIPVDFVKIEGEFVRGALSDWRDRTFIRSIITLAKGMEIKTVAEYVENETLVDTLKDLGVDYGQGFYFGKPSPNPWF